MGNPNFIWVDMQKVQSAGYLEERSPTLHLDPLDSSLVGEVSGMFTPIANSRQLLSPVQIRSSQQAASVIIFGGAAVAAGILIRFRSWCVGTATPSESASVERLLA